MIELHEILSIVHKDACMELWNLVGMLSAHLFCAIVFTMFILPVVCKAFSAHRKGFRRFFTIYCMLIAGYAATKHFIPKITFPRTNPDAWYLADNDSYVTNDLVHISFFKNLIVPSSANIIVECLESCYTNADDWATFSLPVYSAPFSEIDPDGQSAGSFDIPFENATNYNWMVYTDWVPSPAVHTNGVAVIEWQRPPLKNENIVMKRTGIYFDFRKVYPTPDITNSPYQVEAKKEGEQINE